jgi:hypothetical protein
MTYNKAVNLILAFTPSPEDWENPGKDGLLGTSGSQEEPQRARSNSPRIENSGKDWFI